MLCTGRTAHRGSRGVALLFLDHDTRRGIRGQRHDPAALWSRELPATHRTGGWLGPRAGLDRRGKSRPIPGFDPRTVQPVTSCYTYWANPAHELCLQPPMKFQIFFLSNLVIESRYWRPVTTYYPFLYIIFHQYGRCVQPSFETGITGHLT